MKRLNAGGNRSRIRLLNARKEKLQIVFFKKLRLCNIDLMLAVVLLSERSLNPIPYCRFKYINVYIFQRFELNAISAHTRLAKFFPYAWAKYFLSLIPRI